MAKYDFKYKGTKKDDYWQSGNGNDLLIGKGGNDTFFAGNGNDVLKGGKGDDFLDGGEGNDILKGGKGDDIIVGGKGSDILTGGKGNDTFSFYENNLSDNDVITDFEAGDILHLNDIHFVDNHSIVFDDINDGVIVYAHGDGKEYYVTIEGVHSSELTIQDDMVFIG